VRDVSGLARDNSCHGAQHLAGNGVDPDPDLLVSPVARLVQLFVDSSEPSAHAAEGGGVASFPFPAMAGTAAVATIATVALAAGGWYARRRLS
jgi:hypothetical protein